MGVESAEMTKHAINAFLGMSITFINEIASICENIGADAHEVEAGLKSEMRIGPAAYLSPGAAFSGGTLARDIEFLKDIGSSNNLVNPLISAVRKSNDEHKKWIQRRLVAVLGDLKGKRIAVWGLTYKPGTNTLRRSLSVEMCNWLRDKGVEIAVHDPSECELPDNWLDDVVRSETPLEALEGACALVIATQWPEYREIAVGDVENITGQLTVFDSNRFLSDFNKSSVISYYSVGAGA
jgi:UDPglucose 6-dehydrogenase